MDTLTSILATMTVALVLAALHAWRIGNDLRDVRLLGAFGGAAGAGAACLAWL
jgi:hypothetical protein